MNYYLSERKLITIFLKFFLFCTLLFATQSSISDFEKNNALKRTFQPGNEFINSANTKQLQKIKNNLHENILQKASKVKDSLRMLSSSVYKIGQEFMVNSYTNSSQERPSLSSISNERFVIAWRSILQDGSGFGVFAQMFASNNGSKIGQEFQVNSYTNSHQEYSSVSSLSNERFVIAWHSYYQDGSDIGVFAQMFFSNNGSKIGQEFQVNSYTNSWQIHPSVCSLSNERFVITWMSLGQDGSGWGVFAQMFVSNNGSKIGQEFQVNSYTSGDQMYQKVSSLSNERFVITWHSNVQDGSGWGVFAQMFASNNGSKIGQEFMVNNYRSGNQEFSSVSSLSNERFIITWQSCCQDGSGSGVFAQMFASNNGSKIGQEFQVNSYTNSNQEHPSVSSISNERFVITWKSDGQDGSGWGVFAQMFASNNGSKIGQEFQVNSYTNSNQEHPSVSSISNERFVITWHSDGYDGSGSGVFAQIFSIKDLSINSTNSSSNNSSNTSSNASSNSNSSNSNSSNSNSSNSNTSSNSNSSKNTSSNASSNSNSSNSNSSNSNTSSNSNSSKNTSSNASSNSNSSNSNSSKIWIIIVPVLCTLFVIGLIFYVLFKKYQKVKKEKIIFSNATELNSKQKIEKIPIISNEIELNELNQIELNDVNPIENIQINNNLQNNTIIITPNNDNNENQLNEIERIKIMTMKTPEQYLCPITLGIFVNPILVHPSGFTYEGSVIYNQIIDPQTRDVITQKTTNRALKSAIIDWMKNLTVKEIELNNENFRNVDEWIHLVGLEKMKNDSDLKCILKNYEEAASNKNNYFDK